MTSTEVILTLECSILAIFIFLMVGALVLYKWRTTIPQNRTRSNKSRDRNYIILPHTSAEPVQLERNVKQVNEDNSDNGENTDHPLIDDRTEAGRLYFSLKYDDKSSILTIKLIKGENLPLFTNCDRQAFVNVQIISHKTDYKKKKEEKRISTTYQRTYRFPLFTNDLASHTIRFEISRFDRYSKKYDLGYVTISLAELQTHGVDISREAFFTRSISPWRDSKPLHTRKRKLSNTSRLDESPVLRRVRKDSKTTKRRPRVLWHKLSHAVHAGLYQQLIRGRRESLQWDPFLLIQKYEYADSDEYLSPDKQELQKKRTHDTVEEETSEPFPKVLNSINESPGVSNASSQPSDSSPENEALKNPVNREFYRLVHSPVLSQSDSADPVTSWSIPETFRFPPTPVRLQSSTVLFQSASGTCQTRHDRLHKLTSLSSSYRKRLLRKSQKRATVYKRNKLTRMEPLHRLLYLGKDTRTEKSYQRMHGDSESEN